MGNRTRKIAEILGRANHSTGKLASDNVDVSFENITDTGTEGTRIAVGTTAQRGNTAGQLRYNSTLSRFEATGDGSAFLKFATPHSLTSIDYPGSATALNTTGGETFTIQGSNFTDGLSVTIDGTSPDSISVTDTVITVTGTPAKSAQTYTNGLVVTQDGLALSLNIDYSGTPSFTTASGSLGSFDEGTSVGTLVAGTDVGTSHTVTTGTLPTGTSINSGSGDITGTLPANTNTEAFPENGGGDITTTFTVTATDAENQTASRQFSIKNKQGDPLWDYTYYAFSNTTTLTTNEGGASDKGSVTVGNASNVTSQTSTKKFGTNAIYIDNGAGGNSNHLIVSVPSSKNFKDNDYLSFEGWGYLSSNSNNQTWGTSEAYGNQGFIGVGNTYMSISIDSTGRVGFYQYNSSNSPDYRGQWDTSGNISTGAWFHFIFQFEDNQVRYWKDGTYIGTISRTTNNSATPNDYRIGGTLDGSQGNRHWDGYFDELKLTIGGTSGLARISGSSSFTLPAESLRKFST